LFSSFAQADESAQSISLKAVFDSVDVKEADFDASVTLEGTYSYYLAPQWAVEASLNGINDSESEKEFDNTGSYRVTINSLDFMVGARFDFFQSDSWSIYARGGLMFYKMDIELDEEFYVIKPPGGVLTEDDGFGYYLGGGASYALSSKLNLSMELQYRSRLDVLDDSSRPFDVNTFGILIGGGYTL
jgi:opacity protein-like surface antigen